MRAIRMPPGRETALAALVRRPERGTERHPPKPRRRLEIRNVVAALAGGDALNLTFTLLPPAGPVARAGA